MRTGDGEWREPQCPHCHCSPQQLDSGCSVPLWSPRECKASAVNNAAADSPAEAEGDADDARDAGDACHARNTGDARDAGGACNACSAGDARDADNACDAGEANDAGDAGHALADQNAAAVVGCSA